MSKSWAPLWSTITTSSLWEESKEVRIMFLTMLAIKDSEGRVFGRVGGLGRVANLSDEESASAIRVLESPDTRAPGQPFEGRRIAAIEGGWQILNHVKYVDMIWEHRKEQNRLAQQRYREKVKREMEQGVAPRTEKRSRKRRKANREPGDPSYLEEAHRAKEGERIRDQEVPGVAPDPRFIEHLNREAERIDASLEARGNGMPGPGGPVGPAVSEGVRENGVVENPVATPAIQPRATHGLVRKA